MADEVGGKVGDVSGGPTSEERLTGRLDRIEGRIDRLEGRIDRVDERIDILIARLERLRDSVSDILAKLTRANAPK